MTQSYDIVGIGNAITDILSYVDDQFIADHTLIKERMHLLSLEQAQMLYKSTKTMRQCSGGSVANTIAALAGLNHNAAFIGKVALDPLGEIFSHDMQNQSIYFKTSPITQGTSSHSYILVTPDAKRTMCTYLNPNTALTAEDIDKELITSGRFLYIEGYLWDNDGHRDRILEAISIAKSHNIPVALSCSDALCVDRHRRDFMHLLKQQCDIIFANETEILSLFEIDDFNAIRETLLGTKKLISVTRSEKGAVTFVDDQTYEIPCPPVENIIDTTGAGDLFVAGFLSALLQDKPLDVCTANGNHIAAQILTQLGARSQIPLSSMDNIHA